MEQLLFSNLISLPVASLAQQKKLGVVTKAIVEFKDFGVKGFLIRKNLLFPAQYVSFEEVVDIEKEGLMVRDEEVLVAPYEIIRVDHILKQGVDLIGLPVKTRQKRYLGKIFDFVFDGISGKIQKFYTAKLFEKRIIARSKIIGVKAGTMIVESDVEIMGVVKTV